MRTIIERKDKDGVVHVPYRNANGTFHMADGAWGNDKHHTSKHVIEVTNEGEIIINIMKGYHLRMAPPGRTSAGLIAPQNITVRFEKDD